MVIDASAIIAVLLSEPHAARLLAALESADTRRVSAASVVESSFVLLARFGDAGDVYLDRLLRDIGAEVVAVGEEHVALARDAAARFGRGRHAAGLNFGDCFSYALAAAQAEPLLFVGHDFAKTDIEIAPW